MNREIRQNTGTVARYGFPPSLRPAPPLDLLRQRVHALNPHLMAALLIEAAEDDALLRQKIQGALVQQTTSAPSERCTAAHRSAPDMIGDSAAMRTVQDMLARCSGTNYPVLITGESGTGKELAAAAIHRNSPAASGPFVAVNCGGLAESLISSELFGHERGAFTGAVARRIGVLEQANRGSLFLDEVGELPLELQANLLRFLQNGTIQRVGGREEIHIRTRIIAATNVDLESAVAAKRFRKDLFYRLNVLPIHMPPLRDRGDDVLLIAEDCLRRLSLEEGRAVPALSADAKAALRRYTWPGNVRELLSKVRRALVMSDRPILDAADLDLPEEGDTAAAAVSVAEVADLDHPLECAKRQAEAVTVQRALERNGYNISRTAAELGVSRVTVYNMIRRHGLSRRPPAE